MTTIILSGCNGKMGQVIARLVEETEGCRIVCGVDINPAVQNGFPVYQSFDEAEAADVIIDFSHPSCLSSLLAYAEKTGTPAVLATTGYTEAQKEEIKKASAKVALFYSANMSLGVNVLIDLVKKAATALGDGFDIEIVEKHHNQKIDAPSGTALAIADAIRGDKEYVYDRHAERKKRTKNEIGIHAVRGGTIVGEHEVLFAGLDEIIEIKHTALSKSVFAAGSVRAAQFMAHKPAGLYSMQDLIAE